MFSFSSSSGLSHKICPRPSGSSPMPFAVLSCHLPSQRKPETVLVRTCIFSVFPSDFCLLLHPILSLLKNNPSSCPSTALYGSKHHLLSWGSQDTMAREVKVSPRRSLLPSSVWALGTRCVCGAGQDCRAPGLGSWPPSDEQFPVEGYSLPVFRI